jgi:hypothetical protein
MTREEFGQRLQDALETARLKAEQLLGVSLPRTYRVRLYGAGHGGDVVDVETAADALYLGEDLFYRVIDVGVVEATRAITTVFVRASAHPPGGFEQTWNTPPGSGPFKQLGPAENMRLREH